MREYVILRSELPRRSEEVVEAIDMQQDEAAATSVQVAYLEEGDLVDVRRDEGVRAVAEAMPTELIRPLASGDASGATEAWGVKAVGSHGSRYRGAGVSVAVLDTGIDASHSAFKDLNPEQRDFSGTGNGDRNGHGTHCAGTIFGRDIGGVRIGVAPGVNRVLIGKIIDDNGQGKSGMMFQGMKWAIDEGANVISMSVGFNFTGMVAKMIADGWPAELATSRALESYRANLLMFNTIMGLVRHGSALNRDPIVVAAAGNESRRSLRADYRIGASIPAASDDVVSVAALGQGTGGLEVADFSNSQTDVAAPGVHILSARLGGGLCFMDGTSMACPHVAGVAALWWEALAANGRAGGATVRAKVIASARIDGIVNPRPEDVGMGLVCSPLDTL